MHVRKSKILTLNKRKTLLIGVSHRKRCSEKLSYQLDNTYNVTGFSKSNAHWEAVISTINTVIKHFTKNKNIW